MSSCLNMLFLSRAACDVLRKLAKQHPTVTGIHLLGRVLYINQLEVGRIIGSFSLVHTTILHVLAEHVEAAVVVALKLEHAKSE